MGMSAGQLAARRVDGGFHIARAALMSRQIEIASADARVAE